MKKVTIILDTVKTILPKNMKGRHLVPLSEWSGVPTLSADRIRKIQEIRKENQIVNNEIAQIYAQLSTYSLDVDIAKLLRGDLAQLYKKLDQLKNFEKSIRGIKFNELG